MPLPDESHRQKASDLIARFNKLSADHATEQSSLQAGRLSVSRSPSPRSPSPVGLPLPVDKNFMSATKPKVETAAARAQEEPAQAPPAGTVTRSSEASGPALPSRPVVTAEEVQVEQKMSEGRRTPEGPPTSSGTAETQAPMATVEPTVSPKAPRQVVSIAPEVTRTPPKPGTSAARPASKSISTPVKTPVKPTTPSASARRHAKPSSVKQPIASTSKTPHFASPTRASAAHSGATNPPAEEAKKPRTPSGSPGASRGRPAAVTPGKSAPSTPAKSAAPAAASPKTPRSASIFDRLAETGTASSRAKMKEREGVTPSTSSTSIRSGVSARAAASPRSQASPRGRVTSSTSSNALSRVAASPSKAASATSPGRHQPRAFLLGQHLANKTKVNQTGATEQPPPQPSASTPDYTGSASAVARITVEDSPSTVDTSGKVDEGNDTISIASSTISLRAHRSLAPSPPSPAIANGAPVSAEGSFATTPTPRPKPAVGEAAANVPPWMKESGSY